MSQRLGLEEIRAFWESKAAEHGESPSASWSEHVVIEREIAEIQKHLQDGDRVLDVGCANGYSTVRYAMAKRVDIKGVDYVPEMIRNAQARLGQIQERLLGTVAFGVDDIRSLKEPSASYDKVVVVRVVINLADWEIQEKAISECARVLRPGGLLLLCEGSLQGFRNMNAFRQEWGLPEIPMPAYNTFLDEYKLLTALSPMLELVEVSSFLSTYYVGTRVLKPLLIAALKLDINVADTNMHWNRWFAQLPAWGDYGTGKLFVFRRQ